LAKVSEPENGTGGIYLKTVDMSAVILAGGHSSRMGENKMLLPLGEMKITEILVKTISGLFAECILVTDRPQDYHGLPVRIARDLFDGVPKSSLRGIHGGLSASRHSYNFVVAGDTPFVVPALIQHLCDLADGYDLIIPWQHPHFYPLTAVYSRNLIPVINGMLSEGKYKIGFLRNCVRSLSVDVDNLRVYDPELWSLFNINTPDEYAIALAHYESTEKG